MVSLYDVPTGNTFFLSFFLSFFLQLQICFVSSLDLSILCNDAWSRHSTKV